MRIISGIYGGRQLQAPKNLPVRPTTDYAKSGLFSMLQHRYNFKKLEVADLFAGTGSLTYEFLSRFTHDLLFSQHTSIYTVLCTISERATGVFRPR